MSSYLTELGIKDREEENNSQDESTAPATPETSSRGNQNRGAAATGAANSSRWWVNNAVDDFMSMDSNRQTPVPAQVSPQNILQVARLFGGLMNNQERDSQQFQFLERLRLQLEEEADSGVVGPPPASREFIRNLPIVNKSECGHDDNCLICREEMHSSPFAADTFATRLPCKHLYHQKCIKPWLELHNTCPACREEVPSDDPRWLEKKREEERQKNREMREMMMYN